jgi:AcrR family transcriptional regulator
VGELAGSHPPEAAGLPRGRSRLPSEDVNEEQRVRILRAIIAATADRGYHAVTVSDIVRRARVSREAFYRQFPGKLECFVAALDMGRSIILPRIAAAQEADLGTDLPALLHAMVKAYLETCAAEPEFTRAWALDLTSAGPATFEIRNRFLDELALLVRDAHGMSGSHAGAAAQLPFDSYVALIGGCLELIYRYVISGRTAEVGELEDPMVTFLLSGLGEAPA